MDGVIESMMLFVTVMAVVGFAYDNVVGVMSSDDTGDDYRLYISVLICVVFNITIIEDLASAELQEVGAFGGKLQSILLAVRPWIDNIISGCAMAGGAGMLLRRIKQERKKLNAAAEEA